MKPPLTDDDIYSQPGQWYTVNGRNEYRFTNPDTALEALATIELFVIKQRREWNRLARAQRPSPACTATR